MGVVIFILAAIFWLIILRGVIFGGYFLIAGDESIYFQLRYGGIGAWIAVLIWWAIIAGMIYGLYYAATEVLSGWN